MPDVVARRESIERVGLTTPQFREVWTTYAPGFRAEIDRFVAEVDG